MIVRVAELEIDPDCIEAYTALLSEEIEGSVRLELGVLFYSRYRSKEARTRYG